MTARDEAVYIHGSSSVEQARLELMNEILNRRCLAELGLEGGERVLEMGAGTGIFAAALAQAVGERGRVVAIERDANQIASARRRLAPLAKRVELRAGDAYEPPLAGSEWGGFDLAHTRFLLEHVARPQEIVRVLVRAVRPGGRIVLIDDDHSLMRFFPDPGPFEALWHDYASVYTALGFDPMIGRKLVGLLVGAGAQPLRTTQIDYGACAGAEEFEPIVANLLEVLRGVRASVLQHTAWTGSRFDEAVAGLEAWAREPDATLWYALPCAIGVRPEA